MIILGAIREEPVMKFYITTGRKKGTAFELGEGEISIGRKRENNIVLDDESISGRHARIFKEGGQILIEDCDSVNGIELNGKPVKKAALKEGDVLSVGMTEISVGKGDAGQKTAVAPPAIDRAEKEEAEAEVEEKGYEGRKFIRPPKGNREKEKKEEGSGDFSPARDFSRVKIVVAAVLALAVAASAIYVFLCPPVKKRPGNSAIIPSTKDLAKSIFRLRYEKVQADARNIFRYELRIENGALTITSDDLKKERSVRKDKPLDSVTILRIRDMILEQQFFTLPPLIEGKSSGVWDSHVLQVTASGQAQTVKVLNREPPENFRRICTQLEEFGVAETNIYGGSMSSDELKKKAQDSFQRGRTLYDQKSVKAENLFNAIKAFDEAIWYLDSVDPKPELYKNAIQGKQAAADALNEQIKDHQFLAQRAKQLKDWRTMALQYRQLLEKLPDENDKRYKDAQVGLLDAERSLRPK